MNTKSLAIILVLAIMILSAGSVYPGSGPPAGTVGPIIVKGHPWEDLNNTNGPFGSSAMFLQEDHKVVAIRIFSDFFIWIYIKDMPKGSNHQKESIKTNEKSCQIIFPW
jgi:hypothetical protein